MVSISAADVNLDGFLDIVIGSDVDGVVMWYENTGDFPPNGAFPYPESEHLLAGGMGTLTGMAIGDINRDGKPDIIVSRYLLSYSRSSFNDNSFRVTWVTPSQFVGRIF